MIHLPRHVSIVTHQRRGTPTHSVGVVVVVVRVVVVVVVGAAAGKPPHDHYGEVQHRQKE